MKKIFNKFSKIIFVLGIIALITMVLIVANTVDDATIDGIIATTMCICLVIIFVFCMFAVVSAILAIIEGLKKDKVAFLKKIFSNVIWITIAHIVPYVLDYFYEYTVPVRIEIGRIVFRVFITAFAIIGGEYMLADHSKEDNDGLHF